MQAFDPRSIILISFFVVLLQAIILVALSGAMSRQIVGLRLAAIAAGLWASGAALVILRGVAPDLLSVYLGNLCLSGAAAAMFAALRDFMNNRVSPKAYVWVAVGGYAIGLYIALASGSYRHLLMTITGFNAVAYAMSATVCWRGSRRFAPSFLFGALSFACMVSSMRFATLFMDIENPAHFYDPISLQRLYLGLVSLSVISILLAYTLVAYDRVRALLGRSNSKLEEEVRARTVELTIESERRRDLERQASMTADAERRRVGRELHDDLGQRLTGISLVAEAIMGSLAKESPELARHAGAIQCAASEAIAQVRRLAHGLMPVGPDAGDLCAALRALASSTSFGGVMCAFECEDEDGASHDQDVATNLYRIAQEAVTNAVRHGRATRVQMHLSLDEGRLCLTIRDNGIGFNVEEAILRSTGAGLAGIEFRASVIDFDATVASASGQGCLVTVAERCRVADESLGFEPTHGLQLHPKSW